MKFLVLWLQSRDRSVQGPIMRSPAFFLGVTLLLLVSACASRDAGSDLPPKQHKEVIMQSHCTDYLGASLHYQTGGKADAPVLVLLHGGFGSIDDFAALLPRLQEHFRLIAIDTRGHGRSTLGQAPLSYAQIADDTRHILNTLGIARFALFGFSDGGTAAYRIGAADPGVEKIITVGAHWHYDNLRDLHAMFGQITVDFVRENMPQQAAAYEAQNPEADLNQLTGRLQAMWLDNSTSAYPNETISRIGAPVLAIRGEDDFLLSLPDLAALKKHLPKAHLMNIPFASHEAIREEPDMLWAAIMAFYR
mgnify:CR=1 FL=1